MKFVIDRTIPFIEGVFEQHADVTYCEGSDMCAELVRDADAIITRSRTRCDAALLEGSKVRMIATATTVTGHIDMDFCQSRGIFVTTSAGSNAGAVMNYVFSALYGVAARKGILLSDMTFGIIGAGNVGRKVATMARKLGFKVMTCDPYISGSEASAGNCRLETLLSESNIVSLHASLNESTVNLADSSFFDMMRPGAIFINTANGMMVVEEALSEAREKLGAIIIDTWRNEPDINRDLLAVTDIATPHIAGYSYSGKQLSTAMAVRSVARFFGLSGLYSFFPATDISALEAVKLDFRGMNQGQIASAIQYNYPVFTDDFMFRINPDGFKQLRDNYSYRREFYTD